MKKKTLATTAAKMSSPPLFVDLPWIRLVRIYYDLSIWSNEIGQDLSIWFVIEFLCLFLALTVVGLIRIDHYDYIWHFWKVVCHSVINMDDSNHYFSCEMKLGYKGYAFTSALMRLHDWSTLLVCIFLLGTVFDCEINHTSRSQLTESLIPGGEKSERFWNAGEWDWYGIRQLAPAEGKK